MEKQIFESPQTTLKNRVKTLQAYIWLEKPNFKLLDFQKYVIACNPKYSTPAGFEFMRKVWYKQTSSVELTEIMEQLESNIKQL